MNGEGIAPMSEIFQNLTVDHQRCGRGILYRKLLVVDELLYPPPLSLAESHKIAFTKLANRGSDVLKADTILVFPVGCLRGSPRQRNQIAQDAA